MLSLEDAIRVHVQNLQISGKLQSRNDDIDTQLERIEEAVAIVQNYETDCDYDELLINLNDLKKITNAFYLANEFTHFSDIIDDIENALAGEIQDIFEDYPAVEHTVMLMRQFELILK